MRRLDESTGEPDGVDGVLITGGASTSACFVREEELREGDEGFATEIEEMLS